MPTVSNNAGTLDIYLPPVDQFTTAHDAAHELWAGVHKASKEHGGRALIRTPDEGEFGYVVFWESGPIQWSQAYVVAEGATAPGFTSEAADALSVRFTDLN